MADRRVLITLALIVATVAIIGFLVRTERLDALFGEKNMNEAGCTKEARVCADGTVVTRSGPSCTFTECPTRVTDLMPTSTPDTPPEQETLPDSAGGEAPVACTADAKQCPDGSYVGRTGPKCEFVCPSVGQSTVKITVQGVVTVGPTCPAVRVSDGDACADKPYKGPIALTNTSTGAQYETVTEEDGSFTLILERGVYDVSRGATAGPFPSCSGKIEILSSAGTIPISCDSGIR